MRIKLDENIPVSLAAALTALGHDIDTVPQERLTGKDDKAIWRAAQKAKRFLITQDLDFSDIRVFAPGTHYGILLIRLRDPGRRALNLRIEHLFKTENVNKWAGSFVVATDSKIRVRTPKP